MVRLPNGYTRLSYVESDGTSASGYVDTGIVLNSIDLDVEVDFQFTDTASSMPKMAWGYMASGNLPRWGFGIYSSKWLGSPNATATAGSLDANRHTAVLSVYENDGEKYAGTIDGETLYSETALGNVAAFKNNALPVYLFTRNNNGTAGNFASVRIFGFRVTKAGVVTHDLIPCLDAHGAVGFYDVVTSTFLAGTGSLKPGAYLFSSMLRRRAMMVCQKKADTLWLIGYGFYVYAEGNLLVHTTQNTARAELVAPSGEHYIPECPTGSSVVIPSDWYPMPLPSGAKKIKVYSSTRQDIYCNIYTVHWDGSATLPGDSRVGFWRQDAQTGWVNGGEITVPATATHWVAAIRIGSGTDPVTSAETAAVEWEVVVPAPDPGNLYDETTRTTGYYIDSNGNVMAGGDASISDYIAVEIGKTYEFSGITGLTGTNNKRAVGFAAPDGSGKQVYGATAVTGVGVPYSYTFTAEKPFVRLSFNTLDTDVALRLKE